MLVQELHIELDLICKRIHSNSFKRIEVEEKDWYLNMAAQSYVQGRRNVESDPRRLGFQETRKRLEDLEFLMTSDTLYPIRLNDKVQYVVLPHDICGTSTEVVNSSYNCKGITKITSSRTEYVAVVPFDINSRPLAHYAKPIIGLSTSPLSITKPIGQYNITLGDIDLRYDPINYFKDICFRLKLNSDSVLSKVRVYWEKYDNNIYPESLIFVTNDLSIANTYTVNYGYGTINIYNFSPISKQTVTTTTSNIIGGSGVGRMTKSDDFYNLQSFSFGKSKYDDTLLTIRDKKLYIATDDKFIVDSVNIEYLRNPQWISLANNCSIDQGFNIQQCHEIVGLAGLFISRYAGLPTSEKIAANVLNLE